jgi:hypothetical protein
MRKLGAGDDHRRGSEAWVQQTADVPPDVAPGEAADEDVGGLGGRRLAEGLPCPSCAVRAHHPLAQDVVEHEVLGAVGGEGLGEVLLGQGHLHSPAPHQFYERVASFDGPIDPDHDCELTSSPPSVPAPAWQADGAVDQPSAHPAIERSRADCPSLSPMIAPTRRGGRPSDRMTPDPAGPTSTPRNARVRARRAGRAGTRARTGSGTRRGRRGTAASIRPTPGCRSWPGCRR